MICKKGVPKKSVDGDNEYENVMAYYDDSRLTAVFMSCTSSFIALDKIARLDPTCIRIASTPAQKIQTVDVNQKRCKLDSRDF